MDNWSNWSRSQSAGEDFIKEDELERIPDAAGAPEIYMRKKTDGPNASEEQFRQ